MSTPLLVCRWLAACAVFVFLPTAARAERLVSAFDPKVHVKPPLAQDEAGRSFPLQLDGEFLERAARFRSTNPGFIPAAGDVTVNGEVVIVQGDDEILDFDGSRWGIRSLPTLSRKVIEKIGDNFEAITVWLTFQDRASARAVAYEMSVRNDVQGLGPTVPIRDMSAEFGSRGVLRSILNMKTIGLNAGDTQEAWSRNALPTWGQEAAHRWMMFMMVRDPRTGRTSDALLGRDCAHYSRFVDTQASVQDGHHWRDNGDGSFTLIESNRRYGNLDLYGMGLMAPDEMPPFFFIDDIAGYRYPRCGDEYDRTARPQSQVVRGTRVDVTIDDIIAANGERIPTADDRQDYWREALVILTLPNDSPSSPTVMALAARLNKARLWWEDWNRHASQRRLVICTQISGDCGDPRSDVSAVRVSPTARTSGALSLDVQVTNGGARAASGVVANVEATYGGRTTKVSRSIGGLAPGAERWETLELELDGLTCGADVAVKAFTQSDHHYSRNKVSMLVGAETRHADGFEAESGWTNNPDGSDTSIGAVWERGQPEGTEILRRKVQPATARTGSGAWVTGLAAASASKATFVRQGRATLQSPAYDATTLRDPRLRYWVSFAGVRASMAGALEPSAGGKLSVFARGVDATGAGTPWVAVDELANDITGGWTQRSIALPADVLAAEKVQLRFVAEDATAEQGGVEAAIDDVEITSNLPSCYTAVSGEALSDGGGCDCGIGGRRRTLPATTIVVLAAAVVVVARRRRRR